MTLNPYEAPQDASRTPEVSHDGPAFSVRRFLQLVSIAVTATAVLCLSLALFGWLLAWLQRPPGAKHSGHYLRCTFGLLLVRGVLETVTKPATDK